MNQSASFETIPVEIRLRIYEHLLSWKHSSVIKIDPTSVRDDEFDPSTLYQSYDFQTAIMRVSRRIHRESVDYFRSENVFVGIETEPDIAFLSGAIPMIKGFSSTGVLWNAAVTVRLTYCLLSSVYGPRLYRYLIVGAHLSSLVHMMNAHLSCRTDTPSRRFGLQVSMHNDERRRSLLREHGSERETQHPAVQRALQELHEFRGVSEPRFADKVPAELARSLTKAWKAPRVDGEAALLVGARKVLEAKRSLAYGDLDGARMAYKVALYVLGPTEETKRAIPIGDPRRKDYLYERPVFLPRRTAIASLLATYRLIGERVEAYVAACVALADPMRCSDWREQGESVNGYVSFYLGCILGANERWDDAMTWLLDAQRHRPEDPEVKKATEAACNTADLAFGQIRLEFQQL